HAVAATKRGSLPDRRRRGGGPAGVRWGVHRRRRNPVDRVRDAGAARRQCGVGAASRDAALDDRGLNYSLATGAWLCISLTRPELPKSISDIADCPPPAPPPTRPH